VTSVTGTIRSLTIAAKPALLHAAMEFVRSGAREADLPELRLDELDLLIEELFINVCRYAYADGVQGMVTLTFSITAPGELSVEVADQGAEFNPLTAEPPPTPSPVTLQDLPIGGYGIFLVKVLATSLNYRRDSGWNRLTFAMSASS
jgi:anti-sigma regulatory factor (Ser/Thr protein kinase)